MKGKLLGIAATAALVFTFLATPAAATHQPANKPAVAASSLEIIDCTGTPGAVGCSVTTALTVLSLTQKLSDPTDLLITFSTECALWTRTKTKGNQTAGADGRVVAWIEIDGIEVISGIAPDGTTDEFAQRSGGRVVFCERAQKLTTGDFTNLDATIDLFIQTRNANAFTWGAIGPVGSSASNVHLIEVKVTIEVGVDGTGEAESVAAGIGKRTLVVVPIKMANDATF